VRYAPRIRDSVFNTRPIAFYQRSFEVAAERFEFPKR
jgi:hypothetical protein